MTLSPRQEALRRAAEMAARASLIRLEARGNRVRAGSAVDEPDARLLFETAAADMDRAAEGYDRTSEVYLAFYGGADVAQDDDDDADGL